MSLSKATLSAIQQAGTGLHRATVVVSAAVRDQAEHMVSTVARQPFQAEGEQAFANFKTLARLAQELQAMEEQLRNLHTAATELSRNDVNVLVALPRPHAGANEAAEDVLVKTAPVRRSPAKAKKPAKPVTLTANDSKVLDYLKTVLKVGEWSVLTGATVSKGAEMPLGSVGVSLTKVVSSGAVLKKGRGSYQLAA